MIAYMGYDYPRIYSECAEQDCAAVIPLRKGQKERDVRIPRGIDEWLSLYRRRSAVERELGRLKHSFGLAFLRVRGSSESDSTPTGQCLVALPWHTTRPG